MRILLAASEAVPFCKTGGLADVIGALSQRLGSAGHDVCLFLPKYRGVDSAVLSSGVGYPLEVPLGGVVEKPLLRFMQWRTVSTYFLDYPSFYDRPGLYGPGGADYPDNDRRFALLARAVIEGARAIGFKPDVIHCHDWQTALVPAYLRQLEGDPFFSGTASVLTVHNTAYQGKFPKESLAAAGFPASDFAPTRFEFYGAFSFLKAGLVSADLISTVSPTYAREMQDSPSFGFGLEGLLKSRAADVSGILNGLDVEAWNPENDHALPKRFSLKDFPDGKAACKRALQKESGLASDPRVPLVGVVSRLDYQKGLDLALEAVEPRLGRCQLVVVGVGDPALAGRFKDLAARHPGAVHFHADFDDPFARRVYAASDLFLMPSRYEPCGLGQMIAMRYGAVPVASATGGLSDTVVEKGAPGRPANGFLCRPNDAADLAAALDRALAAYAAGGCDALTRAGMACDFAWDKAVPQYAALYKAAAAKRGAR